MYAFTRSALACGLAVAAAMAAPAASGRLLDPPIRLVVPYAAGGPTDVFARLVGEYLGRDLKQAVIVENKGGAQGAIGAEAVAHSEPDGYTLFVTAGSIFVLNPLLYKKLSYDPARDFRMLAVMVEVPVVMGRESAGPGQDGCGIRGLRQTESRKTQFRFGRDRGRGAPCRRNVHEDGPASR